MTQTTIKVDRFDDGTPRKFTAVGSYPIFYVTKHSKCLCPACAAEEESNDDNYDPIVATDANWEDPELYCDGCSERIESAYAEVE